MSEGITARAFVPSGIAQPVRLNGSRRSSAIVAVNIRIKPSWICTWMHSAAHKSPAAKSIVCHSARAMGCTKVHPLLSCPRAPTPRALSGRRVYCQKNSLGTGASRIHHRLVGNNSFQYWRNGLHLHQAVSLHHLLHLLELFIERQLLVMVRLIKPVGKLQSRRDALEHSRQFLRCRISGVIE